LNLLFFVALVGVNQVSGAAGQGRGNGKGMGPGGGACEGMIAERFESLPPQELSTAERDALIRIREDEKLARDVYTTLGEKWNLPIFDNIARAEQHHMELTSLLVTRYEIEDPVVDDATGAFKDPELGALYARLVAKGQESMEDALGVGATIEDLDLADLQKMIGASDNEDFQLIANNLAKGSRNHLRAFTKVLDKKGYDAYTAQYLSQEQIDQITAAEHERRVVYDEKGMAIAAAGGGGGKARTQGGCKGNGQGKGQGNGKCKGQGQGQGQGQGCCKGSGPAPEEG
jgi:hypothetical protein